ncbi:hypothetical protein NUACC21_09880 [Scytonema sp. NUACC21]
MVYRLKCFTVATLVLSVILPTSAAESRIRGERGKFSHSKLLLAARVQTSQQKNDLAQFKLAQTPKVSLPPELQRRLQRIVCTSSRATK